MRKTNPFHTRRGSQISVFLENAPGTLARVAGMLGRRRINILALSVTEGIDHGYVRMVVDRHAEAVRVLRGAGQLVIEKDVVLLELPNRPGAFARVAAQWARAGINLEYAYCANRPDVDQGLVVVRLADTARALAVLRKG